MYKRRERIGQGWLGALYSGEDASGRSVRLIPLQKCTSSWLQEVRDRHKLMASRLVHRALPSLGIHSIGGEPYWVGGWRNGVNLSVAMAQYSIPYPVMTAIVQQLVSILLQARTVGVVHGDLHPQTIWLTANGEVWLDGFGQILGREIVETRTSAREYTSPSGHATSAGDIYSIGVILVEALLDGYIFESGLDEEEHQEIISDLPARLRDRKLPKGLIQLLLRMVSFSDSVRISQEKVLRKLDNKAPENVVHSWLQSKYPNIYISGAPEQKIAHEKETDDRRILDMTDDFDDFHHDIGSLDLLFQNISVLPTYDGIENEQSDDIIDFEDKREKKEQEVVAEDLVFHFDEKTVVEEITSEEASDEEHTEMFDEQEVANDDDPLEDDESVEEHTQAVELFEGENQVAEEFFTSEVTQQLFSDETQEFAWIDQPEAKKGPLQYIGFVAIVSGLIFMGLYSDQLFDYSTEEPVVETEEQELFPPQDPELPQNKEDRVADETKAEDPSEASQDTIQAIENGDAEEAPQQKELATQAGGSEAVAPSAAQKTTSKSTDSQKQARTTLRSPKQDIPIARSVMQEASASQRTTQRTRNSSLGNTVVLPKSTAPVAEKSVLKNIPSIEKTVEDAEEIVWGTSDDDKSIWKQKKEMPAEEVKSVEVVQNVVEPETGTVQLIGEVEKIVLIRDGKKYMPGTLEAGLYQVHVTFTGLPPATIGSLKLEGGKKATITCDSGFASCQIN